MVSLVSTYDSLVYIALWKSTELLVDIQLCDKPSVKLRPEKYKITTFREQTYDIALENGGENIFSKSRIIFTNKNFSCASSYKYIWIY